jgi:hypothetical protein
MKNILRILSISLFATLTSCVNSDVYGTPDLSGECSDLTATRTTSDILALATPTLLGFDTTYDNDIIEAIVTSSDEGGNFYKSISLISVDGTKGFSMPVDDYNLYNRYEPGRKVYINLKGNYIQKNTLTSAIELGSFYNNDTPDILTDDRVGRISGVIYKDMIVRSCQNVGEDNIVNNVTISQAKNDAYLNKLIEFDNVQFKDESVGRTYYDPTLNNFGSATNHTVTDASGNTVIVRVSQYANFSQGVVPSKSGKIRGVMTKYNNDYQFMIRTLLDVKLENDRLDIDFAPPVGGSALVFNGSLNENFESYAVNLADFPKYINDPVVGSRYWQLKSFSNNKYIQMTSFGGTPEANRTLFFVPVEFTASSIFSFKSKSGYTNGNALKVYYTTDYVAGTNALNATFTDITSSFTISPGLSNGYPTNFTNSGNYAIPTSLNGNGYFVFEYVGNGAGVTSTIQIDDIVIN